MTNIEVVERPHRVRRGLPTNPIFVALRDTVDSGKAIRIDLSGARAADIRNLLYVTAKRHGLIAHLAADGPNHLIAWAEKRPTSPNGNR